MEKKFGNFFSYFTSLHLNVWPEIVSINKRILVIDNQYVNKQP